MGKIGIGDLVGKGMEFQGMVTDLDLQQREVYVMKLTPSGSFTGEPVKVALDNVHPLDGSGIWTVTWRELNRFKPALVRLWYAKYPAELEKFRALRDKPHQKRDGFLAGDVVMARAVNPEEGVSPEFPWVLGLACVLATAPHEKDHSKVTIEVANDASVICHVEAGVILDRTAFTDFMSGWAGERIEQLKTLYHESVLSASMKVQARIRGGYYPNIKGGY
jgi:hypothetical protein